MRRSEAAFTLLEVLAAVALLGILYTVLAGVATQGLRGEGESRRRLEASLLADRKLAEIETGMNAGIVLPLGRSEVEEDLFTVTTEVRAFELPELPEAPEASGAARRSAPGAAAASLFPDPRSGVQSPVRRVEIVVSWLEGFEERQAIRTTYAFDSAVAAGLVAGLAAQAADR